MMLPVLLSANRSGIADSFYVPWNLDMIEGVLVVLRDNAGVAFTVAIGGFITVSAVHLVFNLAQKYLG